MLLCGLAGALGRHLCKEVGHRKIKFRALITSPEDRRSVQGTGAWSIEARTDEPDTVAAAMEGVEVVVCVDHPSAWRHNNPNEDRRPAASILAAAQRAGVQQIIVVADRLPEGYQSDRVELLPLPRIGTSKRRLSRWIGSLTRTARSDRAVTLPSRGHTTLAALVDRVVAATSGEAQVLDSSSPSEPKPT